MRTKTGLFLAAVMTIGAGGAAGTGGAGEDARKELAKFAGRWTVSELTYNGQDSNKYKINLTFKGSEAILDGDEEIKSDYARVRFKLDPTTKPKIIDFLVAGGSQKDTSIEGIYEFKGNELRICAQVFGKDRPGTFASPEGTSIVLLVLKRVN